SPPSPWALHTKSLGNKFGKPSARLSPKKCAVRSSSFAKDLWRSMTLTIRILALSPKWFASSVGFRDTSVRSWWQAKCWSLDRKDRNFIEIAAVKRLGQDWK